jgi:hypothetical protein
MQGAGNGRRTTPGVVSVWRVALPLLTVAALLISAGVATGEGHAAPARMSGQYRVAYRALGGAAPIGVRVWGVVPTCKHGACAVDITSRAKGAKSDGTLRFRLRGSTYIRRSNEPGFSDCVDSTGHVLAYRVYARRISQHLHATRVSPLGRALAFTGAAVYTYRPAAHAVALGCKASVQRYTFTGRAVSG